MRGTCNHLFKYCFPLSDYMPILTIFHKTAQLVLPINLQVSQGFLIPQFHLLDDLHGEILIATSSRTTIVLS